MNRKDSMLRAFLENKKFREKYVINESDGISLYKAKDSSNPVLMSLAKIIDKYEEENLTPLYQQIINLLNNKL
jgi:hypothetical protein